MLWKLFIKCIIFILFIKYSYSYDSFTCCNGTFGSCRASCENLSLVQITTDTSGGKELQDIKRLCHLSLTEFWECMNRTLQAVARGISQWSGSQCCSLALSHRCQNTCATALSRIDLQKGCRQSDEQTLYSCLERQEIGDECCGNAQTSECHSACKEIFRSQRTPSQNQRNLALEACNDRNPNIVQCIKNFTDIVPNVNLKQYLPCCTRSHNHNCTQTCQKVLSSVKTSLEAIEDMQDSCGNILPHDPLWQCFLSTGKKPKTPSNSNEVSRINQIGMDSAKLYCCQKAVAPKCRRLCTSTFSNDWTETRGDFEFDCLTQVNEIALKQCLDDVDEPCELGCDGLSFCTNFNNRPTELFRSCNMQADLAARSDIELWLGQGFLKLPGIDLPIRNISQCSPETWKAVACTLQIKPCTRITHANQICREDCFDILSKCMDWTRMNTRETASSLCKKLSLDDSVTPCISLKPFLEESDTPRGNFHISSPCRGNPCNSSQVCHVNRNGDSPFTCPSGCPLGETSPYLVPIGAYVRILSNQKDCKDCHKICRCSVSGRIDKCQPLPMFTYDSCNSAGKLVEHGSWFYVECNICSCFAGEITCTKKQCRIQGISEKSYTSLPCNCPVHHVPVCGLNGNTYPSACVAKCTGLQDAEFTFGPCRSRNACDLSNCNLQSKCIPNWQVCLTAMQRPCTQYKCVNTTDDCEESIEPVCDTDGRTHSSLCAMVKAKAKFSYTGKCLTGCQINGPICGINGVTYKSECEAWSDYSLLDYEGVCSEIGLLTDIFGPHCTSVKCKSLPSSHCNGIIPPGACCPICSGAIRIVYSRKQIDRVLYALNGKDTEVVTLKSTLRALENLIEVAQCRLSGYLTVETDLFIAVQNTAKIPNNLMIEICNKEADKIATLIATQSHRITSELSLSALTVANIVQPSELINNTRQLLSNKLWIIMIIIYQIINIKS